MRARLGFVVSAIGLAVGACQPKVPPAASPALPDGEQYCAGWMLRHMRPYCLHPMTAEQASHRADYRKMSIVGGKVVRVEFRNGAGGFVPDDTGDVGFDVRSEGGVTTMVWFDRWSLPTGEWRISGLVMRRFTPWGAPSRETREDAYVLEYTLDARGFIAATRYVDEQGKPAKRGGVHATRYLRDENGDDIERATFDASGAPAGRPDGLQKVVQRYGPFGCFSGWERFDAAGRPHGGVMGVPRGVETCDAHGNPLTLRWFDGTGTAAINTEGVHGWNETRDAHGSMLTHVTVGLDGKPAPLNGAESGVRYRYDARGYVIERSLLGPRGEPFVSLDRNSGDRYTLGPLGELVELTHVDANGHPVADRDGIARWRHERLANGLLHAVRFFDADGAPVKGTDGVPTITYAYDTRRLRTDEVFLDADGRAAMGRGGYAKVRYQRDEEGRVVGRTHLDLDGAVVLVPGARTMWFTYAGADVPRPRSIPREEAQRRADEALSRLREREPWENVARKLSGAWDKEARYGAKSHWYAPLWDAIAALKPGDPPVLVDTPRGYIIVERKE